MELKKTAFDNSLIENDVLVNNGLKTQIRQTQTKAKDIQAKIQEFDISHPLYNQNCVITGI
ncbi:3'-5' exonuclease, partial [Campylobacter coli CVM 41970]